MAERYNAAVAFVDRHLAEGRAEKVAFRDPRRSLSYGELHDQASRVGPALAALGIAPEHRVVMLMLDTVDFPVVFWGAIRAGIIPVPLNTLLRARPIRLCARGFPRPARRRLGAAAAGRRSRDRSLRAPRESRRRGSGAGQPKHPRLDDLLTAAAAGRRAGRDLRRRGRLLALLFGLDRHAEGRQARPFEPDRDGPALRRGRARHRRGRRRLLGRRSSSSPTASATP